MESCRSSRRPDVEKLYELLKRIGATILDAPADYPYSPGYFAVCFTDPDGLKVRIRVRAQTVKFTS
jgi:hypothetical protein